MGGSVRGRKIKYFNGSCFMDSQVVPKDDSKFVEFLSIPHGPVHMNPGQ